MTGLNLKLLGQFECRLVNGTPLTLQTRKAEVLLAYLALEPGVRHPRNRLINLLWSNRSEEQGRNSLRQALSAIKKPLSVLKTSPLEIDRNTIQFLPGQVEVDVQTFEQLAIGTQIKNLAAAAALYRGEFLEGIHIRDKATEDWLAHQRDQFKRRIVEVLIKLSTQYLAEKKYASAVDSSEKLVHYEPLTESGWRTLMLAYHGDGDRNHGLLAYKRCCDVLSRELGVQPEAETSQLRNRIQDASHNKRERAEISHQAIISTVNQDNDAPQQFSENNPILVLPFNNLSNDSDQQYFSEGITEGVIVGLSAYSSLSVLSRHYSFAIHQQNPTINEIADKYGVRYIVEGSVRKTPQRLRITTQLVDTKNGNQIWGKRFDADLENIFDIEDELTRTIVASVKGKMNAADEQTAYQKPARDMNSYDLLMKGKYHLSKFNPKDNLLGREALEKCIALDPDCELAHNYLYRMNILDWLSGWTEPREQVFETARKHIERAIALNGTESIIQASYAEFLLFDRNYEHCQDRAERAYRLNPNDTETLATLSTVHAGLGNVELGLEMADNCRTMDPFHPWIDWVNGIAYYTGKRFQDALDTFKMMPNPPDEIEGWIAICAEKLGKHTTAEKHLQKYVETVQQNMARPPKSLEDWHKLWQSTSAAKHDYAGDYPFDVLCDVGLGQYIDETKTIDHGDDIPAVVVLPFDNLSGDQEQEYFSDGITDSIIYNLSLFPNMRVKSRSSSFAYKDQIKPVEEISKELSVDFVVEGSIRKNNDRIRIIVQLIDGSTGNQVWGERYDAVIEDIFLLEEKLSNTIAATVTGRIESELQKLAISGSSSNPKAYDLLLQGSNYLWRLKKDDIVIAIEKLDQCLALEPNNHRAHAYLYHAHAMDYLERWSEDHKASFAKAAIHANKAIEIAPDNSLSLTSYAEFQLFSRNYEAAQTSVDKALRINPHDPEAASQKGTLLHVLGESKQALVWAEKCLELDPHHPWGEWALSDALAGCKRFAEAIEVVKSATSPTLFLKAGLAYYYAMAGQDTSARSTLQEFLKEAKVTMKSFPQSQEEWYEYWTEQLPYKDTTTIDKSFNVLKNLGLCDQHTISSGSHNLPTIVTLPFENLSGDPEQEYFSDGITDSIILNLSLFNGLNVRSRHSCFLYKNSEKSIEEIGTELDADYIIEGSIRKSMTNLRLNVQLVETTTNNQIWGKRYDGNLEDIFELEQTLSLAIAGAISGKIGKEFQQAAIKKSTSDLKSYDFYLRGLYHMDQFTPDDFTIAISMLEKSIEADPEFAEAYILIAIVHEVGTLENWVTNRKNMMDKADIYIKKGLSLGPENAFAHAFMAEHMFFQRKFEFAEDHADRAIELNPTLPDAYSQKAWALNDKGNHKEAEKFADLSLRLDPSHPYTGWIAGEIYRGIGQYDKALKAFQSIPSPPNSVVAQIAACLAAMGRDEDAKEKMRSYHKLAQQQMPSYPTSEHEWRACWFDCMPYSKQEDADRFFQLLLDAGLCELQLNTFDESDLSIYPSIAVLPFRNLSNDPEQEYFSDGISENIIRGLSMYKGLIVKSSQASFAFRQQVDAIQEISNQLDVKYIVDGSVRKVDKKIRLSAQLIESESGNQLWGKHYDAELEDVLKLEEELSHIITSTIRGRIDVDIQRSARRKPAGTLQSYDFYLRGIYHIQRFTNEDQRLGKQYLRKCIELDPDNANAHAYLAGGYYAEVEENLTSDRKKTLSTAKIHIEHALAMEPENAFVHGFMAEYFMYTRDFDQAERHADKALELNPTLPDGYSMKAWVLSSTRRYEESLAVAEKCMSLDPHHAYVGWIIGEIYRNSGEYHKAIDTYRSMPLLPLSVHLQISICFAGAGMLKQAKSEMRQYLNLCRDRMTTLPPSKQDWYSYLETILTFKFEEDTKKFFNLALEAGLCDYLGEDSAMPSIAVLPFQNLSGDTEQDYFAAGITHDIINLLSKFRHLKTVSGYSTALYKDRSTPISQIAAEQDVRFILDGGIRKNKQQIRINAQVIDTENNTNVWSDQFDRNLDDVFAVQDEIVMNIASAMKVNLLEGERAMKHTDKPLNVKAWEYCILAAESADSYIKNNIAESKRLASKAIALEPDYFVAWVLLGWCHWQEAYTGWSQNIEDSLDASQAAAEKALALNIEYWDAWALMGFVHIMRDEPDLAVAAGLKAAAIAPGNFDAGVMAGFPLNYAGQYDQAIIYYEKSLRLCPVHPNWAHLVGAYAYQKLGELPKAIDIYQKGVNIEPESSICRFYLMDALLEAGHQQRAQTVADEINGLIDPLQVNGIIRSLSHDQKERDRFRINLVKMGFIEKENNHVA